MAQPAFSTGGAAITTILLPSGLARLHLSQPAKLNALDTPAVEAALAAVRALERDPAARALLITGGPGPGGRPAFCAGGDVRAIRAAALAAPFPPSPPSPFPPPPPYHACERVFQAEYNLLGALASSRLPALSLVDGVWMGLGVGLALSAGGGGSGGRGRWGLRVATERTVAAMPEAAIGLFPDVGFSALAAALEEEEEGGGGGGGGLEGLGLWMGLTGGRVVGAGAAVASRLATHGLPSSALPAVEAAVERADLGGSGPLDLSDPAAVAAARQAAAAALAAAVEGVASAAGPVPGEEAGGQGAVFTAALASLLPALRPALEWGGSGGRGGGHSLGEALQAARAGLAAAASGGANPAAAAAVAGLAAACPLSLALTLRLFSDARRTRRSFADALAAELPPAARLAGSPHFAEGVRCALVDRKAVPAWPGPGSTLETVTDADVDALLAPLPDGRGLSPDFWAGLAAPGGGGGGGGGGL